MNAVERYRDIVIRLVEKYGRIKPGHGEIETYPVIDRERDHYGVMSSGWDGYRRVHGCVIHIDLINGKVWLQYDGTDRVIAEELVEAGIPREDIVLAFQPEDVRQYTGYAVG